MIDLITLKKQSGLIKDVVMRPLKVNRDESGSLTEVLKTNWEDVLNTDLPFAQCYFSVTASKVVRDLDLWHVHPTKQTDRFVCARGTIVTAVYDNRKDSTTYQQLNLFLMGESQGDETQFLITIPQNTLHGFAVVSDKEAVLLNFPTTLYDPQEEGRVKHIDVEVKFNDGIKFTWERILKEVIVP